MLYKVILSFESLWDEILRFVNPNESNWAVTLNLFLRCPRSFYYWRQSYCFVCHTKCLWLKRSRNKASLNPIRNSSAGVLCNCKRAKVQAKRDSKNKTMQFFLTYLRRVRLENWVKRKHLGGCHAHFSMRLWYVTYSARIVKRDLSSFLVDFHKGAGLSWKWWTDSKHHFNLRLKTLSFNVSALYFTLYSRYAISELQKLSLSKQS